MSPKGKLKIIPLGGVEEIGKNIYVLEYADDIVILDCGSIFPKEDMLGIDLFECKLTILSPNTVPQTSAKKEERTLCRPSRTKFHFIR